MKINGHLITENKIGPTGARSMEVPVYSTQEFSRIRMDSHNFSCNHVNFNIFNHVNDEFCIANTVKHNWERGRGFVPCFF